MNDDISGLIAVAFLAIFVGFMAGVFVQKQIDQSSMDECRENNNVYACELQPVKQPSWVKPNAENT